jgi:hypothetical protein
MMTLGLSIALMLVLNIRYSLDGYGIREISLHPEVWAQTNGGTGTGTGSGTSDGAFECAMKKDVCKFTATTTFSLEILKKLPNVGNVTLNVQIDLSSCTQIYNKPFFFWPWEDKVRCGSDVTCNTFLQQTGLF